MKWINFFAISLVNSLGMLPCLWFSLQNPRSILRANIVTLRLAVSDLVHSKALLRINECHRPCFNYKQNSFIRNIKRFEPWILTSSLPAPSTTKTISMQFFFHFWHIWLHKTVKKYSFIQILCWRLYTYRSFLITVGVNS